MMSAIELLKKLRFESDTIMAFYILDSAIHYLTHGEEYHKTEYYYARTLRSSVCTILSIDKQYDWTKNL